jgi:hypothetical protein
MEVSYWKSDWQARQQNIINWWNHTGLVLCLTAEREAAREPIQEPKAPQDWETWWTDPDYRLQAQEAMMARRDYLLEAFPYFDPQIGPGSLGTFLGSNPHFVEGTVWYDACITDPDRNEPIKFSAKNNHWLDVHMALIDKGLANARGRYLVGVPDLIENLDTLAALRGDTNLLYDLIERPGWVQQRLAEINQAFFQAFDVIYERVKDKQGANCFSAFALWGPGKTAKVQCDISATISAKMFKQFVVPHLTEQCQWLDYSMYHLDGTTCLQHLDVLLEIEPLRAIEWTPQAGLAGGGAADWYDIYRRIKAGGKSFQAVGVDPKDMLPLLDAVGPEGTFLIFDRTVDQKTAEKMVKAAEPYYK